MSAWCCAGDSQATAASLANAFTSGGSTASAYAQAVAQAIAQNGCSPYQQTLARALPLTPPASFVLPCRKLEPGHS